MSHQFADELAEMSVGTNLVTVNGGETVPITFNEMFIRAKAGATTTAFDTWELEAIPYGLQLTFDNTEGSGEMTVNGGEVVVPAGAVYAAVVSGDGAGGRRLTAVGGAVQKTAGLVTSDELGVIPMNGTGGQLVATGEANAAALNAWYLDGWRTNKGCLDIAGKRIGLAAIFDLPPCEGFAINTTGMGSLRVESQYGSGDATANKIGGQPSGFVWTDKSNLTGAMLVYRGAGLDIGTLNLWGNYGTGLYDTLIADTANRKEFGLLIEGQQSGLGVGKIEGSLMVAMCGTAIKTLATPAESNADETHLTRFKATYCDVGIHFANRDSLAWHIDYYDSGGTTTAILLERGGDLKIGHLVAQGNCETGISITGNDSVTSGAVVIDWMQVDAQAPATYRAVKVTPTTGANSQSITVGYLRGQAARETGQHYFELADFFGELNLLGGMHLVQGSFKVTDGTAHFPATVRITNCRFHDGVDLSVIRRLFTTDSRGYVNVLFTGCRELSGYPGSANDGKFFDDFVGQINIVGDGDVLDTDYYVTT